MTNTLPPPWTHDAQVVGSTLDPQAYCRTCGWTARGNLAQVDAEAMGHGALTATPAEQAEYRRRAGLVAAMAETARRLNHH